jgi:hypothetical protein
VINVFFFSFFVVLGFKLRASHQLDRYPTTLSIPPVPLPAPSLFALIIFQIRAYIFVQGLPWTVILLLMPPSSCDSMHK